CVQVRANQESLTRVLFVPGFAMESGRYPSHGEMAVPRQEVAFSSLFVLIGNSIMEAGETLTVGVLPFSGECGKVSKSCEQYTPCLVSRLGTMPTWPVNC